LRGIHFIAGESRLYPARVAAFFGRFRRDGEAGSGLLTITFALGSTSNWRELKSSAMRRILATFLILIPVALACLSASPQAL
jgi:hypothetical protein